MKDLPGQQRTLPFYLHRIVEPYKGQVVAGVVPGRNPQLWIKTKMQLEPASSRTMSSSTATISECKVPASADVIGKSPGASDGFREMA